MDTIGNRQEGPKFLRKVVMVVIHPELTVIGEIENDTSIIYKPRVVEFKLIDPVVGNYEIILKKMMLDPPSIRTDHILFAIDVGELWNGKQLIDNYQLAFTPGFNPLAVYYKKMW